MTRRPHDFFGRVLLFTAVILSVELSHKPVSAGARRSPEPITARALEAHLFESPGRPARLIHLWASWCAPCVAEWPSLASLLRRSWRDRDLEIITIALDEPAAMPSVERVLAKAGQVPGRALVISADEAFPLLRRLDSEWDGSVPTTLILDPEGHVALAQRGHTRLDRLSAYIVERIPRRERKDTAIPLSRPIGGEDHPPTKDKEER